MSQVLIILLVLALGAGLSIGIMFFTLYLSKNVVSKKSADTDHSDMMEVYMDMRNQRDSLLVSLELANTTAKATAFANEKALAMMHELLSQERG